MSDSEDKVLSDGHVQHPPEAGEPASHETVLPAAGGLSQDKVRNIFIFTISLQKFWSTPHFIARGVKDLISSIRFAPFNVVTITNVWVVWSLRKAQVTNTGEGGLGGGFILLDESALFRVALMFLSSCGIHHSHKLLFTLQDLRSMILYCCGMLLGRIVPIAWQEPQCNPERCKIYLVFFLTV